MSATRWGRACGLLCFVELPATGPEGRRISEAWAQSSRPEGGGHEREAQPGWKAMSPLLPRER